MGKTITHIDWARKQEESLTILWESKLINTIKSHWIECQNKRQLDAWRLQVLRLKHSEYAHRAKKHDAMKKRFLMESIILHLLAWITLCLAYDFLQKMNSGETPFWMVASLAMIIGLSMMIWVKVDDWEGGLPMLLGGVAAGIGCKLFAALTLEIQTVSMEVVFLKLLPISILFWGSIIHGALWWRWINKGYSRWSYLQKIKMEKEFLAGQYPYVGLKEECDQMAIALMEQDELKKLTKLHKITHTSKPKRL